MTVTADIYGYLRYDGNGSTTVFPYTFKIFDSSELQVSVINETTGGADLQTLGTDYTVSGVGLDSGGNVTMVTAPTASQKLDIRSVTAPLQPTSFKNQSRFLPEVHETALDRLTRHVQNLERAVRQSLRRTEYEEVTDWTLPIKTTRANNYLYFDSDGEPTLAAALASETLSRSTIGEYFIPQTASELAAGVTPTYYYYFPGDVRRYGAVGDGAADNTSAVQYALNVAAFAKSKVHFPATEAGSQTVYLCGKVQVYADTNVTADPGVKIQSTVTVANDHVFECISTLGSGVSLSANTAKRGTTVTVASTTGLSAGGIVVIRDSQYKWSTNGRNLEFNVIDSISGAGPYTITLKNRLIGAYLTASSAEIIPVSAAATGIVFENVYVDIPSSKDGGAFYFQDAYGCLVKDCRSSGQKGQPGVQIWRSAYVKVVGGDYSNGQSQSTPGYGYGANIAQSSHHCEVSGATFKNVRECAIALGSKHCGYVDCISVSSYDNGFNTHADGNEDCYFDNCHSYYARSKGFYAGGVTAQAPDKRVRFINCESHYSGYLGFWADGASGVESEDISFEGCKAFHYGDDTATSYGFYAFRSTRPRIVNCVVDADGESNARALVKIEICTNAQVKRNTLRSATAGWGIIHANCTGVVIEGNSIANIASAQGIYAESTASTAVLVRDNTVDNNTVFTKNSGDIHENNEYSTKRQTPRGATASVADGGTITHTCVTTPTAVRAVGSVAGEFVSVTAIGGTTFTVAIKKHDGTAGTSQTVYWEADS